jgi:hypothetical protein
MDIYGLVVVVLVIARSAKRDEAISATPTKRK